MSVLMAARATALIVALPMMALVGALTAVPAAQATPVDIDAALRGLGTSAGASTKQVEAIKQSMRAGDFSRAEALARALRDATAGDADHELLLALTLLGGEKLGALRAHIEALDAGSANTADRIRIATANHFKSQGRTYLARYFLRAPQTPAGERERLLLEAQVLSAARRVTEAKAAQLAILKRDRDNRDALLNMARLHLLEHTPARALAYTKRLTALDKGQPPGPNDGARRLLAANAHMLIGDLQQAQRAFTELSRGPVAALATFNLALIDNLRGDYQRSLHAFQSLQGVSGLPLDPRPGVVLAWLALGDANAAQQALAGAPRADPLYVLLAAAVASAQVSVSAGVPASTQASARGGWSAVSGILRGAGRLFIDMALPGFDARRYLGAKPALAAFDLARRNYLYRLGYFRLAASGEVPGGGQPPAPAFSLLSKARSAWKAGRAEEALELYAAVRLANPQLIAPLIESADIHFFRGANERAIRLYQQAVQAQPQLSVLRLQLGDLLSTAGRPQAALRAYAALTEREPNNPHAAARIASVLFEQQGDAQAALAHAELAYRNGPGNAQFSALLGRIRHALGEPEAAQALLRQALNESRGTDPEIFAHLGDVLLALRERDKARRAYEHALNSGAEFARRPAVERAYLQLAGLDARA